MTRKIDPEGIIEKGTPPFHGGGRDSNSLGGTKTPRL